jgi:hypothetical protein
VLRPCLIALYGKGERSPAEVDQSKVRNGGESEEVRNRDEEKGRQIVSRSRGRSGTTHTHQVSTADAHSHGGRGACDRRSCTPSSGVLGMRRGKTIGMNRSVRATSPVARRRASTRVSSAVGGAMCLACRITERLITPFLSSPRPTVLPRKSCVCVSAMSIC